MRGALRVGLACLGLVALPAAIAPAWLLFDPHGLPDVQSLAQFAPSAKVRIADSCTNVEIIAIPYEEIGSNLRSALSAVEAPESLSMQIGRSSFCSPARQLVREVNQIRFSIQLERHFSRHQLFTIFANRLYFGRNIVGIESASQHYFHRKPDELSLEESAYLAGLAKSPSRSSFAVNPDRALLRRNQVIDAMVQDNIVSQSDAMEMKARPLSAISD